MAINRSGYLYRRFQKFPWWQRIWKKHQEQQITTPQKTTRITPTTIDTTISTTTSVSPTISSANSISNQTPGTQLTTENINNENHENHEIITHYKIIQNITRPKLFGFSREEAETFPSRISEIVLPFSRKCNHSNLPKYTNVKIMELKSIFNSHQCTDQNSRMQAVRGTAPISLTSSENWERNQDGSVTRVRRCLEKGTLTKNNNLRLCAECQAVTELPENM